MNIEDRDDIPKLNELQSKLACMMLQKAISTVIQHAVGKSLEGVKMTTKAIESLYPEVLKEQSPRVPLAVDALGMYLANALKVVKDQEATLIGLIYDINVNMKRWVQSHCPEVHEKIVEIEREKDPLFDHKSEEIKEEMDAALTAFKEVEGAIKEAIRRKQEKSQNN